MGSRHRRLILSNSSDSSPTASRMFSSSSVHLSTPLCASPTWSSRLVELTEGEPLLVRYYAEDLRQASTTGAPVTRKDLDELKPGFGSYFKRWFDHQEELWEQEKPGIDRNSVDRVLMVLAFALGPLDGSRSGRAYEAHPWRKRSDGAGSAAQALAPVRDRRRQEGLGLCSEPSEDRPLSSGGAFRCLRVRCAAWIRRVGTDASRRSQRRPGAARAGLFLRPTVFAGASPRGQRAP